MAVRIALVGRPNVGKSTLFNRLVGQKLALVDDTPGVTRDFREAKGRLSDLSFTVIDTAGLDAIDHESTELAIRIREQTHRAIAAADILLFMIDARQGVTLLDRLVASQLRGVNLPVILVANKAESKQASAGLYEAYELGLGEVIALSAEHGEGMADLYQALTERLHFDATPQNLKKNRRLVEAVELLDSGDSDDEEFDPDSDELILAEEEFAAENETPRNSVEKPLQMAIIGRPNVGKSTLVNRLIGEERMLTGPEAGLTRDSIAVALNFEGNFLRIIDTAGLRRQASVSTKIEKLAVADSLRAVRFAEVVVLVIDATVGFDKQDLTIAGLVADEGRAMVVAVNKWDAIGGEERPIVLQAIRDRLTESLGQLRGIPLETISAKTGARLDNMLRSVVAQERLWSKRATTADINRWLAAATSQHPPPLINGRPLRLRYGTQIKSRPPTLAVFTSRPAELPDSYCRYLIGSFRDHFGLPGVPIRLVLRKSANKNPFADGKGRG
ncbi:MAG: ribosome biogenesis GTPase Der [Candidatus Pacebacteria bacterium]|nr:ribosome biogenesis GTPase Der [Candidatus Paceibacterota bacterium]